MQLFITRHGETAMNAAHRICGRTDIDINETGILQAHETGRALSGRGIARIIASPMLRAQHTAQIIAEEIGVSQIETDGRLIEQNYGIFENADWNDPGFWAVKRQFAVRYPEGESMLDLAARLYPLLDELKRGDGAPTLLVCHGGICRMLRTYFEDVENEAYSKFSMPNCGVLEYEL